jgi:hypothetical protein
MSAADHAELLERFNVTPAAIETVCRLLVGLDDGECSCGLTNACRTCHAWAVASLLAHLAPAHVSIPGEVSS